MANSRHLIFVLALAAAVTLPASSIAQSSAPAQTTAQRYYAAPSADQNEPLFDASLRQTRPGVFTLAKLLSQELSAIEQCQTMRLEMSTLINGEYGSYAVHPGWLEAYQQCLVTRDEELQQLAMAIADEKPRLLEGKSSAAARRATDIIARLEIYQGQIRRSLVEEFDAQTVLVTLYNSGTTDAARQ